ncbi:MAG: DUF2975 domain-containing protein [Lachnospiraceae bacterium]|jgi:hypothetical protein|nr:DUF2975 domain-containing protein [Lachnospiraceae bacterium]MBR5338852.1 DUF2975 domain-containing protein [Lachnospiraceae bacterium]MBR6977993.1 DUF2975 domain-containing protein [Lachnospiraceae bacterium]
MNSNTRNSALLTEIFIYILAACLLVLDIGLWPLSGWYMKIRNMTGEGIRITLVVILYACSVLGWFILWKMLRLIRNIRKGIVFTEQNVSILRAVSLLCLGVGILTFAGGFFYQPLFFVTLAALFLTLVVRVVKNVMHKAVEMKDELDLTV